MPYRGASHQCNYVPVQSDLRKSSRATDLHRDTPLDLTRLRRFIVKRPYSNVVWASVLRYRVAKPPPSRARKPWPPVGSARRRPLVPAPLPVPDSTAGTVES